MFFRKGFLIIVCLMILNGGALCSLGFAQGDFLFSLSSGVVADPGQTVALYFVLDSPDSIAGVDVLLEFDPILLTCNSVELLPHFQYFSYDKSVPGRLRVVVRRHQEDSTYLPPLPPGNVVVGLIWFEVTSQDLLMDIETPVSFFEDPQTPFSDNRLERSDDSFVAPPELSFANGGVFIKHPLYGDINDDGYAYTIADAIFFLNFLAGGQQFTPRQRANSDVNKDGVQASMVDLVQLIQAIVED